MFNECLLLYSLEPLKNWDVSNENNFSYIFFGCRSLSYIKPLKNRDISNGNNFSHMLAQYYLSNVKSL